MKTASQVHVWHPVPAWCILKAICMESLEAAGQTLGLTFTTEESDEGRFHVLHGDIEPATVTVTTLPADHAHSDTTVLLELDFTGGRDDSAVREHILGSPELVDVIAAVTDVPLTELTLDVEDREARLGVDLRMPLTKLNGPTLTRLITAFVQAGTHGALPLRRRCSVCGDPEPRNADRWRHMTCRICRSCRVDLEQAAEQQAPQEAGDGPSLMHIDGREFRQRMEALRITYESSPRAYWMRLVGWVLIGQGAMLGLTFGLLGLVLLILASVWLVIKSRAWIMMKVVLVKGAKLLIAAVAGVGVLLWSAMRSLTWRPPLPKEELRLRRTDLPRLFSWVDDLARSLGSPSPDVVVLDNSLNASAAEIPRGFGRYEKVLSLGVPVLEFFSVGEVTAILGHELGHIRHRDSRSKWVYRTWQAWIDLYGTLGSSESAGAAVRKFADWYVPNFLLRSLVVQRGREIEADRESARLVSADVLAGALLKVNVMAQLMENLATTTWRNAARDSAEPPVDLPAAWRAQLARFSDEKIQKAYRAVLEEQPAWTDTHPLMSERLQLVGVSPPDRVDLDFCPAEPACSLVDDYPKHRTAILEKVREEARPYTRSYHRQWANHDQRASDLEAMLVSSPDLVPALVELARVRRFGQDIPRAVDLYRAALQRDPSHGTARRELMDLHCEDENWSEAASELDALLARWPERIDLLMAATNVHEKARRPGAALSACRSLLDMGPPAALRADLEQRVERLEALSMG